jgi:hypothetical protein
MFFLINLVVLGFYYYYGWTEIGPGLLFCLFAMIAETIDVHKRQIIVCTEHITKRMGRK